MAVSINGTSGLTFNDGTSVGTASSLGMRNRIINGAMEIDQRNAGASVTQNTSNVYTLDRWLISGSPTSKFTAQRSTTAPAGFINSMLVTSSSAYSVASGDYFYLMQGIEGVNVADLGWGTASAKTVTLSFWVRSSLTGNFGGALRNLIAGATRSYPFTYAISSANTWEYKTITIAGDTTGTWATDTSVSVTVCFGLGTGATFSGTSGAWASSNIIQPTSTVSVVGTNGATFYLTGVQLEVGSVATPFERRLFNQELTMCMRYYQKSFTNGTAPYNGYNPGNTGMPRYTGWVRSDGAFITQFIPFLVPMRVPPTINRYYPLSGSAGQGYGGIGNAADANTAITDVDGSQLTEKGWAFYKTGQSGGAVGQIGVHWDTSGAEL